MDIECEGLHERIYCRIAFLCRNERSFKMKLILNKLKCLLKKGKVVLLKIKLKISNYPKTSLEKYLK